MMGEEIGSLHYWIPEDEISIGSLPMLWGKIADGAILLYASPGIIDTIPVLDRRGLWYRDKSSNYCIYSAMLLQGSSGSQDGLFTPSLSPLFSPACWDSVDGKWYHSASFCFISGQYFLHLPVHTCIHHVVLKA